MNSSGSARKGYRDCATVLMVIALALFDVPSHAQSASGFPERPVRLLVGFAPGGALDVTTRILAKELTDLWGKTVMVDNKVGASGLIANELLARAPGDGYTLLLTSDTPLVSVPFFQEKMPYDTLTDLVPVAMVGAFPYVLVANSTLKVKTVSELVAMARARPGSIDYASNGVGAAHRVRATSCVPG